jgi:RNA polymerase sigma-70 factor (ECF subfamily)
MSEFHRLVEQQIPRLRRYARALTRNRDRADDLVQDTLARALIKEQFWQPGTNLRAWLFTIMHNQNVNNVRQAARESAVGDIDQISARLPATTDPAASRQMFELERALAQLALEQRQVILLVGLEGMSYQDAAGILKIPVAPSARAYPAVATFFASFWIWRDALAWRHCRRPPDIRHGGSELAAASKKPSSTLLRRADAKKTKDPRAG